MVYLTRSLPGRDLVKKISIVFGLDLEVALRVIAYRTGVGSLGTDYDMSAVCALPYHVAVSGEYEPIFDIFDKLSVALLMLFFDSGYLLEKLCDIVKALFSGSLCE